MQTPYYAVIFTSTRASDNYGYEDMAALLEELASKQQGYLGLESAHSAVGITVSYWENLEAISSWKKQVDHRLAQEKGRTHWYQNYTVRICRVERQYSWKKL